jgi:hypothetical protein
MNKRGGHPYGTMAERIAATKAAAASPAPDPAPAPASAAPSPEPGRGPDRLRHCWVRDQHGRLPALLLEWRRTASGWQGRVVHPVPDPAGLGGWILVEEWLPAGTLDQA